LNEAFGRVGPASGDFGERQSGADANGFRRFLEFAQFGDGFRAHQMRPAAHFQIRFDHQVRATGDQTRIGVRRHNRHAFVEIRGP